MVHQKIQVEAEIAQELPKVWAYWTRPEHIVKWNNASPEWHCPRASNDLTVGGKTFARMEAKDGSFGFDFEGIYDEIIDSKKLSYSLADGRQVTTTFAPAGELTRVSTVFDAENINSVEMQKAGWQAILDNFKAFAEAN